MAALGKLTFCRTSGKFGYVNEEHANQAARRMQKQFGYLRPYPCPDCGWWHLTSRPYRRRPS